jgi:hypothetical protein
MRCSPIGNRGRAFAGRQNFSNRVTFEGHFMVTKSRSGTEASKDEVETPVFTTESLVFRRRTLCP